MVKKPAQPARLTIERLEQLAAARLGATTPTAVREKFLISKQLYQHWKSRGIPTNRAGEFADRLSVTIDELFGRSPAATATRTGGTGGRALSTRAITIARAYEELNGRRRAIIDQLLDDWSTDEPTRTREPDTRKAHGETR
jgi:hypothetical protein